MDFNHVDQKITHPTGGAIELSGVQVPANSAGNVSRVVSQIPTVTTINQWYKLATIVFDGSDYERIKLVWLLADIGDTNSGSTSSQITLQISEATAGLATSLTKVEIESITGLAPAIKQDSIRIVGSSTNGAPIEIWINNSVKSRIQELKITELARVGRTGAEFITYHDSGTWQSATPTGAVTVTSDWAGSGQLSSTSFQNGWAGTAYYEKSSNGWTKVHLSITTIGTTTSGTVVWTAPSGFRAGITEVVPLLGTDPSYGSAAGRLSVDPTGAFAVYGYTGTNSSCRASVAYVSRG